MNQKIPFNKPYFAGNELAYISEAIEMGHASGDGSFTKRCHSFLEHKLGVKKVLLTTSCTHALEMAAILLDLKQGDEFIVPSFTFVSTPNAFVLRGARPVFVDVRPDTLNLDERLIEGKITNRTKAIVPVHYAGVPCEMDSILSIARKYSIPVVEDNAHGLFAKYRGRYLGTLGAFATQSFHETKNLICGEGGALLLNDTKYLERAEIIREKGTNRSKFFRGEVDKYSWVDLGSSYLPSDILAAFLYAQLENHEKIQSMRAQIWNTYSEALKPWALAMDVQLPTVPHDCEQSYHMFYMLMPTPAHRAGMIAYLKAQNIFSMFHYLPLHLSLMGAKLGGLPGDCPVTEDVCERLLRLPFYNGLTQQDQNRVIEAVKKYDTSQVKAAA